MNLCREPSVVAVGARCGWICNRNASEHALSPTSQRKALDSPRDAFVACLLQLHPRPAADVRAVRDSGGRNDGRIDRHLRGGRPCLLSRRVLECAEGMMLVTPAPLSSPAPNIHPLPPAGLFAPAPSRLLLPSPAWCVSSHALVHVFRSLTLVQSHTRTTRSNITSILTPHPTHQSVTSSNLAELI